MSTRTTIVTVFALGLICGVLLALMWVERNAPPPRDTEPKAQQPAKDGGESEPPLEIVESERKLG